MSSSAGGPDFSQVTKQAIQKRAGFICSNPNCKCLAVGPSLKDPDIFQYIGEVAHIAGARKGAARYDDRMTDEQRSAPENALFLCAACADMIDKNAGIDYPAELLHRWKSEHEAWVSENLNKNPFEKQLAIVDGFHQAKGVGETIGLDIRGPAILRPGTRSSAEGFGTTIGTRIGGAKE